MFETPQSFAVLWSGRARIFLWTDQDNPKELAGMPHFVLARNGGMAIFTNRAPERRRVALIRIASPHQTV